MQLCSTPQVTAQIFAIFPGDDLFLGRHQLIPVGTTGRLRRLALRRLSGLSVLLGLSWLHRCWVRSSHVLLPSKIMPIHGSRMIRPFIAVSRLRKLRWLH